MKQRKMLKDHGNTQTPGLGGGGDCHRLAVPKNIAAIGPQHTIDDLNQGAFAGPIFTKQGMDFAGAKGQVDLIIGQATGKLLCDTAQFQTRRRGCFGHDIVHPP